MADIRRELEGDKPSAIERLIAEQIVRCLLHLRGLEQAQICSQQKLTIGQHERVEQLVARAEGRYLRALRTLARVRQLPGAAVQVSVDARQVHVTK